MNDTSSVFLDEFVAIRKGTPWYFWVLFLLLYVCITFAVCKMYPLFEDNEYLNAMSLLTMFVGPLIYAKFVWFKTHSIEGRMVISVSKAGICISERGTVKTLSWQNIWSAKIYNGEVQARKMGNSPIAYSGTKKMFQIRVNAVFTDKRTGEKKIIHPALEYVIDGLDRSDTELMTAIEKYRQATE